MRFTQWTLVWIQLICLSVSGFSSACVAAPPAITGLNPPVVQRGTTGTIELTGKLGEPLAAVWCSHPDVQIEIAVDKPAMTVTVPADASPGLCWLRFYNAEGATEPLPLLIDVLPQLAEVEPNNRIRDAHVIATLPSAVQGVLHKGGEVDTFAVSLAAGDQLIASIAAHRAFSSPMDAVLQVLGPDGFVLEQNDDFHGNDPQIVFTASTGGQHFVRVFAFPAEPNSTINFAGGADYRYLLTLTDAAFVDHLTVSDSSAVGWNLSDDMNPWDLPGLHQRRPRVEQRPPVILLTPQTGSLDLQTTYFGTLSEPQESVIWQLNAIHDTAYRVQIRAQEHGSLLDPVLLISNADGTPIKEFDDASRAAPDLDFVWKAPGDGPYQFKLSDRFGHYSLRHFFEVLIAPDVPRLTLTVDKPNVVLPRDQVLEIPVTINRMSGFDAEVTVTVLGLPDGIEFSPVDSAAKGDSSKSAKLSLKAGSAAAFNGLIQIVAVPRADPAAVPLATSTTPLPLTGWNSNSVWLTVPPASGE